MLDSLTRVLQDPESVADVIRGATTIRLGGEDYEVRARSVEGDEKWLAGLDGQLRGLLGALRKAGNDRDRFAALLTSFPDELIACIKSYDQYGVLPDAKDIRRKASSGELLVAVAKVWRLANPLQAVALAGMAHARRTESSTSGTPSEPTTTYPPSADGPSATSGVN